MTADELIMTILRNSDLTSELRDAEIEALAATMTVQDYKAGEFLLRPGDNRLEKTLMILAVGEVEATATVRGEKATLHLLQPGDIAGIITFAGGDATQISATVQVKQDSKVILLERPHFESLLYYVMRGIVRHVHGIVRRMNMQSVEMTNYIHRTGGRY
jgi:CRP-like cAMP-binding protein